MDITPIATVRSCFGEKFGIPRQPQLADASRAAIELLPPFDLADSLSGLQENTHLWILFQFHQVAGQWSPKVRPPRLGGNKKLGVFATRSPYRPNNIGLSAVRLIEVRTHPKSALIIGGADLMDGTPVLDIKPYIPYADAIPGASSQLGRQPPPSKAVHISGRALRTASAYRDAWGTDLVRLIEQVLGQDPKPAYQTPTPNRVYGTQLCGFDLRWRYLDNAIEVLTLEKLT